MIMNIFVVVALGVFALVVILLYKKMEKEAVEFELSEQVSKFGTPEKVTKSDDKEEKHDEKLKKKLKEMNE